MKFGIKPVYGRIMAYSFIPVVLIILGTYGGIYFLSPNVTTELGEEYRQELVDQHLYLSTEKSEVISSLMDRWEKTLEVVHSQLTDSLVDRAESNRLSYFHNVQEDRVTPRPEFSDKYNSTVDFSVSSYFVYPDNGFGNWSADVNSTIDETVNLDLVFLSIYDTRDDLMWISVTADQKVERRYPFYGPMDADYNPFNTTLFNATRDGGQSAIHYGLPFVEPVTNRTVISLSKGVFVGGQLEGTVSLTFDLSDLYREMSQITGENHRSFLLANSSEIVYHSSFNSTRDILNGTLYYDIKDFETNSTEFLQLITGVGSELSTGALDYPDTTYLVSVISVKGFTFGFITLDAEPRVIGTFDLISLLVIPLAIVAFFLLLMGLLLRRYGFLRNVGLETLVALEQNVSKRLEKVKSGDVEDIGEMVRDEIKEKGDELREQVEDVGTAKIDEVKDQIKNVDKVIAAKINEKLDSFENKLVQALDAKFEDLDDFVQQSKDKLSISPEKIKKLIEDPSSFVRSQGQIFGLDLTSIEGITQLPNATTRLASVLTTQESIPLEQLSQLSNIESAQLEKILTAIPDEYGLVLADEIVKIDKNAVVDNFQPILQTFYQITPGTSLEGVSTTGPSGDTIPGETTDSNSQSE